jgi:transcriptional regulator with XRE-family HTH domain
MVEGRSKQAFKTWLADRDQACRAHQEWAGRRSPGSAGARVDYPGLMADTIGARLGRLRLRRGLTQEQLAVASGVSAATIRKLERDDRTTARLSTLHRLASALGCLTQDLLGSTVTTAPTGPRDDAPGLLAVRQAITPVRPLRGATEHFGELATMAQLRESVRAANLLYQADDYAATTNVLPGLVADTAAATLEFEGEDRTAALEVHTQALQVAGSTLIHLRQNDLAYEALRQAQEAAEAAGNRVLGGSIIVSLCWLLLRQRRLGEAEGIAVATAEAMEPSFSKATKSHIATWGWLLLRASAAAVRNNRHEEAADLMRLASAAAAGLGPDVIDDAAGSHGYGPNHWSSFGPTTVAMKSVENAMIAGRPDQALVLVEVISSPGRPGRPTSNNRNRFLLDKAAARIELRQYSGATDILLGIMRDAPEWLKLQRYAADLTRTLVERRTRALPNDLVALADLLDLD